MKKQTTKKKSEETAVCVMRVLNIYDYAKRINKYFTINKMIL